MRRRLVLAFLASILTITASVGVARPAGATTVDLALEVTSDGRGPFTATDGPGSDSGPSNGIVRTHDHITYRATVNAIDGAADNETIRVEAPTGTSWGELPTECGAGSSVTGQVLTCNLGRLENSARAVSLVLVISGSAPNGQAVAVTGSVSADGARPPGQPVRSPVTTVSAAPRYDLVKNGSAALFRPGVPGPDGEIGMTLTYPITVVARPIVPGQGVLGSEELSGPLQFRDDVSGLEGGASSRALLYTWAGSPCGLNTSSTFHSLPAGRGGGRTGVADSGAVSCRQAGAGQPIDVSFTGTDTSLDSVPDLSSSGGALEGGAAAYVVSATISVWIPHPDNPGATWLATNTFDPLEVTSISGQSNFGTGTEPTANNVSSRTISQFLTGTGYKTYGRVTASGSTVPGSGKSGDPFVTPNTLMRAQVNLGNRGFGPYTNAIACDVFDNTLQTLSRGPDGRYAYSVGQPGARVEYAASAWTTPDAARSATCGDGDATWYADADDVPGGPSAVGRVRVVADVPGASQVDLFSYFRIDEGANGDRIRNFAQLSFGDTSDGEWMHDPTSPDLAAGPLSDFLIRTADLARVTKKVVDPGTDPSTTPDETKTTTAGRQVRFALYPSVTTAATDARQTQVTVTDVLPANSEFVSGSASIPPTRIDQVGTPDDPRQQLTWVLDDRDVNTTIDPIDYAVAVSIQTPPGSITNTVTVSSPDDVSTESLRSAQRAIEVVASGGIAVEKTAVEPVVIVGDNPSWDLVFVNTDGAPAAGVDLIDVLPTPGDAGHSDFTGTAHLAEPVAVDTEAGETALYTEADPASISLDAADASNGPGGSTTWCPGSKLGSPGCPSTLDAVTGVRITRTSPVPIAAKVTHRVTLAVPEARDGEVLANRFGLRASNLVLPIRSEFATVRFVAGVIGDRVWDDVDSNGLQDPGEPGVPGVRVGLSGTDDRGVSVSRATATVADGRYLFTGLRPGDYTVSFDAPEESGWTKAHVGSDSTVDSDVDSAGQAHVTLAATGSGALLDVESDLTVDAGLVFREAPVIVLPPVDPPDVILPPIAPPVAAAGGTATPKLLAFTGSNAFWPVAGGLVLLLGGLAVMVIGRRRRHARGEAGGRE